MPPSQCSMTFTPLVERISIDEAFADVAGCSHLFGPQSDIASAIRRRVRDELGLPISIGVARTKHLAKIASQVAKPERLVVVDPGIELDFLHNLPVELMWGVGPATSARLAQIDVHTIGQLAKLPGRSLVRLLGHAAGEKLTALAWNRDPREIKTNRRGQSALGKQPAEERVFRLTLRHVLFGQFVRLVRNGSRELQRDGPISDCMPSQTIADAVNGTVSHPTRHARPSARSAPLIFKPKWKFQLQIRVLLKMRHGDSQQ
jgi:nucleotidyltransferase/DNA polymerase involved in DNA repair